MLSGLVISIGGLQDSLRKVSILALLDYLQAGEAEDLNERSLRECLLSNDILWILQEYKKCDRVIIPTFKVTEAAVDILPKRERIKRNCNCYEFVALAIQQNYW